MSTPPSIDLKCQRGTTLVELLVTIPIALAVAGSIMGLTTIFSNNEKVTASRSAANEAAQVTLDRMTRDIRQASAVATTAGTPSATLNLSTMVVHSSGQRAPGNVSWDCTAAAPAPATGSVWACKRTSTVTVSGTTTTTDSGALLNVTGSGAPGTNNTIFNVVASTAPAGAYVTITAKVPTRSPATSTSPTLTIVDSAAPLN